TRSATYTRYARPRLVSVAVSVLLTALGIHHLHLHPAHDKLYRRRKSPDCHDARAGTSEPSLAPQPRPSQGGHFRPIHLPSYQARDPAIHLAQAHPRSRNRHHEALRRVPGGLHRLIVWL